MQRRMKEFPMTPEAVSALLERAAVGRISTINEDGYPYTVAVHFVYEDGKIYFHGLPKGQKLDNIARCAKVCFEVSEMKSLLVEGLESPCKADTAYESVVALGDAELLTDAAKKRKILTKIIDKFMPRHRDLPMEENRVNGTAVVEIRVAQLTGKYHE